VIDVSAEHLIHGAEKLTHYLPMMTTN